MLIDFEHVLHSSVLVSHKIGAFVFSAPSPNFMGSHFIPVRLVTIQFSGPSDLLLDKRDWPQWLCKEPHP